MKKQDYTTLANILKREIEKHTLDHKIAFALESVAMKCALMLHVDKQAFLKACGVE